jgi:hypothetical protein
MKTGNWFSTARCADTYDEGMEDRDGENMERDGRSGVLPLPAEKEKNILANDAARCRVCFYEARCRIVFDLRKPCLNSET